MIHISAPGKLMIAGEWAVLEGYPCIVTAVNRRVHCQIEEKDPTESIEIELKDFSVNSKALFASNRLTIISGDNEKLKFAKAAVEIALQYVTKPKTFKLVTWNEKTEIKKGDGTKKLGFGSSSAAVVAIVSAVLAFHGIGIASVPEKLRVYKLAAIAHYRAQGKMGSAFDIAAATFGGMITYRRFDANWLEEQLKSNLLRDVVNNKWPQLSAEELDLPKGMNFAAAWTGKDASTAGMIQKMNQFRETDSKAYRNIYSNIGYLVEELVDSIKANDKEKIIKLINENHSLLSELAKKSKIEIETRELRKLHEIARKYGAGKLSGAGGGDCGIGVCFAKGSADRMKKAWSASGLQVVDVNIENDGVRIE